MHCTAGVATPTFIEAYHGRPPQTTETSPNPQGDDPARQRGALRLCSISHPPFQSHLFVALLKVHNVGSLSTLTAHG